MYLGRLSSVLDSNDDIIDGDVDELDEEPDEAHDGETDGGGDGNLLKLFSVRLGASLHQPEIKYSTSGKQE